VTARLDRAMLLEAFDLQRALAHVPAILERALDA